MGDCLGVAGAEKAIEGRGSGEICGDLTLGGAKPKNGPGRQGHQGQFRGPEEALEGLFLAGDEDVGGEEAG